LRLDLHSVRRAASRTLCTAGSSIPRSRPMMEITTSSSTSVKARRLLSENGVHGCGDPVEVLTAREAAVGSFTSGEELATVRWQGLVFIGGKATILPREKKCGKPLPVRWPMAIPALVPRLLLGRDAVAGYHSCLNGRVVKELRQQIFLRGPPKSGRPRLPLWQPWARLEFLSTGWFGISKAANIPNRTRKR